MGRDHFFLAPNGVPSVTVTRRIGFWQVQKALRSGFTVQTVGFFEPQGSCLSTGFWFLAALPGVLISHVFPLANSTMSAKEYVRPRMSKELQF